MALLSRFRNVILAGVAAGAVALPIVPALTSPAAAAPAAPTVAASSAKTAVSTSRRRISSSRAAVRARRVLAVGYRYRGVPYVYGGSTPRGFDCSGFSSYVVRKALGKHIPRRASVQARASHRISRSAARAGDLVFFTHGGRVYHVGIYAGGNKVLHAPRPGRRVSVQRIWTRSVFFGRF